MEDKKAGSVRQQEDDEEWAITISISHDAKEHFSGGLRSMCTTHSQAQIPS